MRCPGSTALSQALEDESHFLTEWWRPGACVYPERGWRDVRQNVQGVRKNKQEKHVMGGGLGGRDDKIKSFL